MLIVTHEMGFAFKVSDRVVFMEAGRVLLDAPPADVLASEDPRVKDFLSHVHVS
ncbi:Glutamine transport ATP-binding protein GlnQ [compost metagenome]